jgi:hypothetical protein
MRKNNFKGKPRKYEEPAPAGPSVEFALLDIPVSGALLLTFGWGVLSGSWGYHAVAWAVTGAIVCLNCVFSRALGRE